MKRARIPMLLAASAFALGLAACGGPENPNAEAKNSTEVALDNGKTTTTAPMDDGAKAYVEKAAMGDMFEIEASKLALTTSKVKAVKDFAQMMIDAHTKTTEELKPLAAKANITPPSALDNDHMGKLDALKSAKVQDFDDVYIDQQTAAHNDALNAFNDYAKNGKDADLAAFAAKTAPTIQSHLDMVKALDKGPADDITKKPT